MNVGLNVEDVNAAETPQFGKTQEELIRQVASGTTSA